jgi:hypothetical protein
LRLNNSGRGTRASGAEGQDNISEPEQSMVDLPSTGSRACGIPDTDPSFTLAPSANGFPLVTLTLLWESASAPFGSLSLGEVMVMARRV